MANTFEETRELAKKGWGNFLSLGFEIKFLIFTSFAIAALTLGMYFQATPYDRNILFLDSALVLIWVFVAVAGGGGNNVRGSPRNP